MKKYLVGIALLFGISSFCHAGVPIETYYQGQAPLSNKTIAASTFTLGGGGLTLTVNPGTSTINQSGGGTACRNCFTKELLLMPTNYILYVLDGGTTVQMIDGIALSGVTSFPGPLTLPEDHLGPLCLTQGTTTLFNVPVPANGTNGQHVAINVEGYTYCGGVANAGPMN